MAKTVGNASITKSSVKPKAAVPASEWPVQLFKTPKSWESWLAKNHAKAPGIWMRYAKKKSSLKSIDYAQALDVALCYGWIDSLTKTYDEDSYIQKFTPRGPKSMWSKINRGKVEELTKAGRMQPPGIAAVDAAKADGRWDAAYDSARNATVPDDLQDALDANAKAEKFFAKLDGANRYSVLWRVQTARTPEIRAKRIETLVAMLARGEKIHQ